MNKYDFEFNENEIVAINPSETGWYLCKVFQSSYGRRENGYRIATYGLKLLYWEQNVWVVNPRSYQWVDERHVLEWTKVPDDFNFTEQTVKINYLNN